MSMPASSSSRNATVHGSGPYAQRQRSDPLPAALPPPCVRATEQIRPQALIYLTLGAACSGSGSSSLNGTYKIHITCR
ncbi:uncharacterized protein CLUP02_03906 [Colletotrichum lupini]|uniref:Uncharacterized protein n=1 Tax=Colletotrichum lupini TaxID=145971 RepID=A0A9Q8WCL5_9PEZI|nr:uncharacterized protein CLUP02_03906 [Colletotrichum lupini]UQC78429.1 hypothetical protein CLUP02_03906 [Colletotrichum lupini]